MTRWTIETEVNSHGDVVYDVMGKGDAPRKRKQDLDAISRAVEFIRRYGQPGDPVTLVEPDGYRRTLPVWTRRRFAEVSS